MTTVAPRRGRPLLLTLTTVTGLVDAVSILRLGLVFVANMTGDLLFADFLIADPPNLPLSASLFALAGTSGPRGQTGSGEP